MQKQAQGEPSHDPVQGAGGLEFVNHAAESFSDDKFREWYEHRANHLIDLHGDALSEKAADRLKALLS